MTTLELAKLIRYSGCEVDISPTEMYDAVDVTARYKDKFAGYRFDMMKSAFSDPEKILDHTINMCIHQVKDSK